LITYYILGTYLDYSSYFGSIESRGVNENLAYFRPHGIFQEPNGYCTAMFCLLALTNYFIVRRKSIEYIGLLSMFLSLSLWGIVAAILLLICLNVRFSFKQFVMLSTFLAIFVYAFSSIDWVLLADNSITLTRILNVGDDASFDQRSGGMSILATGLDISFLWGFGVNTDSFQEVYGANGLSFLVYSFGAIGTCFLFITISVMLRFSLLPLLFLAMLLTTYPPFSYMYFWLWLGMLIVIASHRSKFIYKNLAQAV
jgi:hypothetical protein